MHATDYSELVNTASRRQVHAAPVGLNVQCPVASFSNSLVFYNKVFFPVPVTSRQRGFVFSVVAVVE